MHSADAELVHQTTEIVSAYVGNNIIASGELPVLIQSVHAALQTATAAVTEEPAEVPKPAVNPKKSVAGDYIVCLEDGQRYKAMKRHLRTEHDLSPDEYRAKWNLPNDYPMVAPNYSAERSKLAKSIGLGLPEKKKRAVQKRRR